jgi:hypothetical protein
MTGCKAQNSFTENKCELKIRGNKKYSLFEESKKDTIYKITPDKLFKKTVTKGELIINKSFKIDFELTEIEINSSLFREYITLKVPLKEFETFYIHLKDEIFIDLLDDNVSYAKRKTSHECVITYTAVYSKKMFDVKYGIKKLKV